jgi:hypothetical protein
MKIVCQAAKGDGSGFHEIGTTHQTVFSHYKTTVSAIRYGVKPWAAHQGGIVRCLVFYADHIYGEERHSFYVQFGRILWDSWVEAGIWAYLPREDGLGRTAKQIASELHIEQVIIDDMIKKMDKANKLTYDATGYCHRGDSRATARARGLEP